jgi:hypothetical protein
MAESSGWGTFSWAILSTEHCVFPEAGTGDACLSAEVDSGPSVTPNGVFDAAGILLDSLEQVSAVGTFPDEGIALRPLNDMWVDEIELGCWVPEICTGASDNDGDLLAD